MWHKALQAMINRKFSTGDVFRFGNAEQGWGYGQALLSSILQYIVIFKPKFKIDIPLDEAITSPALLSGWTADARVLSGDWEIVGNMPPLRNFEFLEYKVEISGQLWVVDIQGRPLRLATDREAQTLSFKSSHSPIAFEKAFKAHHGDLPWEARFNELLV